MKAGYLVVAALAALVSGADVMKKVVVSYGNDTPDNVIQDAMEAIKSNGGTITHVYQLIKGFSAEMPEQMINTVQTMGVSNGVVIEVDGTMSINSN